MMSAASILEWLGFLHGLFPLYGIVSGLCCYLAAELVRLSGLAEVWRRSMTGVFVLIAAAWFVASIVLTDAAVDRLLAAQVGDLPDYSKRQTMLSPTVPGKFRRPEAYRSGEWWASAVCALHVGAVPLLMLVIPARRRLRRVSQP